LILGPFLAKFGHDTFHLKRTNRHDAKSPGTNSGERAKAPVTLGQPTMQRMTLDDALATLRRMLKESEYCFFLTHGTGGEIQARLMQPFTPESDFTLWFGADPHSRKVQEIKKNANGTISIMNPKNAGYASFVGTLTVVNDPAKKSQYWRADWTDLYPGGPVADDYTLIKFTPSRIEMMDFFYETQGRPYSLKPVGLEKSGSGWKLIEDVSTL
jgi:general stress protein 26